MAKLMIVTEPLDTRIERHIGVLLETGILVSGTVILIGGVLFLVTQGRTIPDYHLFRSEPESLRTVTGIIAGTVHGDSRSIMQFGMLLLIATPVARVIFSVFAFLRMRDYQYAVISGAVLTVLLYSLIRH